VDILAGRLNLDYVKANHLEIINGKLTGRVLGEIVTKDVKKAQLKAWALDNDLELKDTVAMGAGANDLPMIQAAGIGIAFCAKRIVEQAAPYRITEKNLYKAIEIIDEVTA
jgi:phosphoserine phosphatase